jgi:hypothetical protein
MTLQNHLKISFLMASAVLFLTDLPARSAVMTQPLVDAPISLRQTWLDQNMARNQRLWAQHLAGGRRAINAASVNTSPLNLQQVWSAFQRKMRFASQLKPSSVTGFLPESRFVNGLWSRRAINSARFTSNHVSIAQLMDWNTYFQGTPSPVISPAAKLPATPSLQVVVPEPSSLVVGLSLIGVAACGRWVRQSRHHSA